MLFPLCRLRRCRLFFFGQTQFLKASQLAGEEFLSRLSYYGRSWLPARDLVLAALSSREDVDPSGRIILFNQFSTWKACSVYCRWLKGLPPGRSICLNSSKSYPCQLPPNPYMSSILTRLAEIGACKQSPSLRKASRVARRCQNPGAGSETKNSPASLESRAVSLCTRPALLVGISQRRVLWRWPEGH